MVDSNKIVDGLLIEIPTKECSLNGIEIQHIQRVQESDKSLKHKLGSRIKILFLTCVLLVLW